MIRIKRVYDDPEPTDGYRVLVDRLWPRGVTKEAAAIDRWMKELAPGAALRKWFDHDPQKWNAFQRRYAEELEDQADALDFLNEKSAGSTVTLVFAARNTRHNNAVALRDVLQKRRAG